MFKKFLIGTLAVVAFVITTNLALASYDFGSAILKVGSRGQYVTILQNLVGATPFDGIFGPKTKAKVVAWQVANGLMADGLFGNLSKAKANETGTNFGTGCTNASGFSTTTGLPCSSLNANTFPAGCTNASGFSPTTGLNCLNNLPPIRGGVISGYHVTVESSLVPTGDMIFALTTPAENGGINHLTGGGATSYINVGVANGTTSVVITGTKLSTQTVAVTGMGEPLPRDDSYNVVATGTGTNPIYTVNTVTNSLSSPDGPGDNVSLTGGNKTFKLTVSETNKTDIVYTVNVQVAPAPTNISVAGVTGFVAPVAGATPEASTALTAGAASYTVTGLTWSPVANPYLGSQVYTATVTLTSAAGYKFPEAGIAVPTANTGTVSAGTTAGGNVTGNTLSYTVLFPATGYTDVTSAEYVTADNTTITITLAQGTFKEAPIVAADFIFGGTDANAIANATAIATYGTFGRTDATHVAITDLSTHLLGSTKNTVTVKGATQTSHVITVTAVSS